MTDWQTLSDDELTARLLARGVPVTEVSTLVADRDREHAIAWLNFYLGSAS